MKFFLNKKGRDEENVKKDEMSTTLIDYNDKIIRKQNKFHT